ncbi:MAG TPA: GTP-binding protein [Afifellaceae bacterium]|nr:GTP-binding protein [Afifellaceae bacterium]
MAETAPIETRSNRLPVSIVTGFLGSGKTTLLNQLVRHPGMADTALIVNEFGEIGIDHALVDQAFENTVLMDSGCICCSIRGDLIDTIEDLFANAALGRIPSFSRILIETTGLADPVPIVHALAAGEEALGRCALDLVVTTVDGVLGAAQLAEHPEVESQIAVGDVILVTKSDIAEEETVRRLTRRIATVNPGIPVHRIEHGRIDPELLFAAGRRAGTVPPAGHNQEHTHDGAHGHAHDHDHGQEPAAHRHGTIQAQAVTAERPLSPVRLRRFLETLLSLRGEHLLRVKGIVAMEGEDRPVVIQGVGAAFSPPATLPAWRDRPRRSELVFIFRGLDGAALEQAFRRMVLEEMPADR